MITGMLAPVVGRRVMISRLCSTKYGERLPTVLDPFCRLAGPVPVPRRAFTWNMEGSHGLLIRRGRKEDIPGVWKLTEEATWNTHQDMIETYFKISEKGWIIAEKDGKAVGCILAHDFNDDLTTVGHFIVSSKMRKHGVGAQIIKTFLEEYGDRNIHFNSISYMTDTYERYIGSPLLKGDVLGKYFGVFKNFPLPSDAERKYHISDVRHIDQSDLIDYDTSYHVIPRPEMLKLWLGQTTAESLVLLEKGKIVGYGSIRPARNGFYLGPLYAEDTIGTMVLFKALVDLIPRDSNVDFFLPHANEAGRLILKANKNTVGLYATFHKCFTKSYILLPKWNNVFAVLFNECGLC
ncbi:uncharacterized protein LOC106177678 [Lingula anatina]|uniref:Uncharacterized protein LOC106177678 n=1 Tax=Lingula anatina TaxID=7574 RepID=A0A1S3K021_LINAN|nr:uncharacterized protein LOC106177678 [Lingula anatina]|eukprot:XP_013415978.1 uncharacterized protein LOC106177678 [Lingula anatina]